MDWVSAISMLTPSYEALLVGAATAVTTSALIEGLGTELDKDGNYYTTPDTHTIPRAILIGMISGVISTILLNLIFGIALLPYLPFAVLGGIIAGLEHLALDFLTGDAIYIKRNGEWQKVEWKKAVQLKRKIESYCADD